MAEMFDHPLRYRRSTRDSTPISENVRCGLCRPPDSFQPISLSGLRPSVSIRKHLELLGSPMIPWRGADSQEPPDVDEEEPRSV